jgi:hypothetical protein
VGRSGNCRRGPRAFSRPQFHVSGRQSSERHPAATYGNAMSCERSILPKWFEFVEAESSHALAQLLGGTKRAPALRGLPLFGDGGLYVRDGLLR